MKERQISNRFTYLESGFHGDTYLLALVDAVLARCDYFIETGTNVGSTLGYVARTYPQIRCMSCEPDKQAYRKAVENTQLQNVILFNETSQAFLHRLQENYSGMFDGNPLFWLDAHGYGFDWPLKLELSFITKHFRSAYILIDDFKVPELECFLYDRYQQHECSFDYIKDSINASIHYNLYYPNYTDRTSQHHPLCGWGLIEYGQLSALTIPEALQGKIKRSV